MKLRIGFLIMVMALLLLLGQPVLGEGDATSEPEPTAQATEVVTAPIDEGEIPVSLVKQLISEVTGQVGIIAIIALLLLVVVILIAVVPMARWLYKSTPPVAQPIIKEGINTAGTLITDIGKGLTDSMRTNTITWDDDLAALIDEKIAAAVKKLKEVDTPERIVVRGLGES